VKSLFLHNRIRLHYMSFTVERPAINLPKFPDQKKKKRKKRLQNAKDRHITSIVESHIARNNQRTRACLYLDTLLFSPTLVTGGALSKITVISQGSGQENRIADTITVVKMEVRMSLTSNQVTGNNARIIIFIWRPSDVSGSAPGVGSIIQTVSSNGLYSPLDFENRQHYTVLRDYTWTLNGDTASPTSNTSLFASFNIGLNTKVQFQPGLTTGDNEFYIIYITDAASQGPTLSAWIRTYYMSDA